MDNYNNDYEKENNNEIKGPEYSHENSAKPETLNEEPRTYAQTYTPGADGYSNFSSNNSYSTYQQNVYKKSPKKKTSKGIIIAAAVVSFTVVALVFSLIGFSIATNIFDGRENPQYPYSDGEGTIDSTTDKINENAPNNDLEDIEKDDSPAPQLPSGTIGEVMTKTQVVSLVQSSVVEITTEKAVTGGYFQQYVSSGAGSGVIISDKGYVITNNHVIDSVDTITVRLSNGNEYTATLIGTDASADIAVIKIEPTETLTVAKLGSSDSLLVGEEIIVIGNPLGKLGGSVTNGIISALDREIIIDGETRTLLQTNAAVNPGNSGGGMFNLRGELVGVVNAKSSGTNIEGLGFAIPIDTAYSVVLQLMEYGYVLGRIDHGLELLDINDMLTAISYHVNTYGVYVLESKYTDEIKNGDRIASIDGTEVSSSADVKTALKDFKVGDTVKVTISRNGKMIDVKLTLREYIPSSNGDVDFGQ